jgi:hypothetical protein
MYIVSNEFVLEVSYEELKTVDPEGDLEIKNSIILSLSTQNSLFKNIHCTNLSTGAF